jgi:ABC-type polysaccharide/polyol phosphate export permease
LHFLIKLNPLVYIIDGYRKCFIYHNGFWLSFEYTIYFWISTIIILATGVILFKKLKPHFADVL